MKTFSPNSFILGTMFGVLLAGVWFLGSDVSAILPFSGTYSRQATTTESLLTSSGAISVEDQAAGDSAQIESVTVPPPGVWVAVREMVGGDLGNVLGAIRVGGPKTNVTIPLLRATEPGRTYAVQLYRDDNAGAFDPAMNSVYVDFDTGSRVVSYFSTK